MAECFPLPIPLLRPCPFSLSLSISLLPFPLSSFLNCFNVGFERRASSIVFILCFSLCFHVTSQQIFGASSAFSCDWLDNSSSVIPVVIFSIARWYVSFLIVCSRDATSGKLSSGKGKKNNYRCNIGLSLGFSTLGQNHFALCTQHFSNPARCIRQLNVAPFHLFTSSSFSPSIFYYAPFPPSSPIFHYIRPSTPRPSRLRACSIAIFFSINGWRILNPW